MTDPESPGTEANEETEERSERPQAPPRGREAASGRGHTIVVGAGMAGLAAADRLAEEGERVTVVEGRDRLGGRIHSVRAWQDTATLDLGASWMRGDEGNPLTSLVEEVGLRTAVFNRSTETAYDPKGRRLLFDRHSRNMEDVHLLNEHMYWDKVKADEQESMEEGIKQALYDANLVRARARDANEIVHRLVEYDHGADAEEVAFAAVGALHEFGGDDVVFPDGMGRLTDHLARGLDVRLEHVVRAIHHDDGVRVRVDTPEGEETLTADRVLVTLPLGVLKAGRVDFDPPLPEDKRHAVERLGSGRLEKLFLRFDEVFWGDAEVLVHLGTEQGAWFHWYAGQRVLDAPILVSRNGGRAARFIAEKDEEEAVGHAMASLRAMFRKAPDPLDHHLTHWMEDPFSQGSFSYTAVGSGDGDRAALGEPMGERVFFAGEATETEHAGTVHGALLSGHREADRILAL